MELLGTNDEPTGQVDEVAIEKFKKTIEFWNGRYWVSRPWKEDIPHLSTHYGLSVGRLDSILNKFQRQPDLLTKNNNLFEEQLKAGIIEEIKWDTKTGGCIHYMPHQPVLRPDKATTKLRIVYDASAKLGQSDRSLNEAILRRPVLLPDLVGILLRFRAMKTAITADVEKAFHMVGLYEKDRDCTRFLWVRNVHQPASRKNLRKNFFNYPLLWHIIWKHTKQILPQKFQETSKKKSTSTT